MRSDRCECVNCVWERAAEWVIVAVECVDAAVRRSGWEARVPRTAVRVVQCAATEGDVYIDSAR